MANNAQSQNAPVSTPLPRSQQVRAVLARLHKQSLDQEAALNARHSHFPGSDKAAGVEFGEQLVALDEDKARAMYSILRAMNARTIVEAGTSFGVSLIWLLAAALENQAQPGAAADPIVFGTENDPKKAAIARSHVREAFGSVPAALQLLEGDILQTIPAANIPDGTLDALLLDIWVDLALPTLKNLLPKFRPGAAVFIDNTIASAERYAPVFAFLHDEKNGFDCTELPFSGGFALCIYRGHPAAAQ